LNLQRGSIPALLVQVSKELAPTYKRADLCLDASGSQVLDIPASIDETARKSLELTRGNTAHVPPPLGEASSPGLESCGSEFST
jgi:hypothetical protein